MSLASQVSAFAVWLMPDLTCKTVLLPREVYDDYAARGGEGKFPNSPSPEARFLMAALWERDESPRWNYTDNRILDPIDGISEVVGLRASSSDHLARIVNYQIKNHHSVTYDTAATAATFTSSLTWTHVMSSAANRYLLVLFAWRGAQNFTTGTYAGASLSSRFAAQSYGDDNADGAYEKVGPATGSNSVILNFSTAHDVLATSYSATGVDQATPVDFSDRTAGFNSTPTDTISGASTGLGWSFVSWDGNFTDTVDAGWGTPDQNTSLDNLVGVASAHHAGASSYTRTDSLSGSATSGWSMMLVSVKAAGGATTPFDWFCSASEPVRFQRSRPSDPSFFIDTKQLTLVEKTQLDKWAQPTNQQARRDIKREQYRYPSFHIDLKQLTLKENPQIDKWGQQTNQQARLCPKQYQRWFQSFFVDAKQLTLTERTQQDKWAQPSNQPRWDLRRAQNLYPYFFIDAKQLTLHESVYEEVIQQPPNQPRFDLRRLQNWYPYFFIDVNQLTLPENVYEDVIQQPPNQPRQDIKRQQWAYPNVFIDTKQLTLKETAQLDKWFRETNQPRQDILRRQWMYPSFIHDDFPVGLEILTMDKWFRPASEPVRDLVRPRWVYGSVVKSPHPVFTEDVRIDKWFQPTHQRFDLRRLQYAYPSLFVDANDVAQLDKWFRETNQTVRVRRGLALDHVLASELILTDRWNQPTNEPITVRRLNVPLPVFVQLVSAAGLSPIDWIQPTSQPLRRIIRPVMEALLWMRVTPNRGGRRKIVVVSPTDRDVAVAPKEIVIVSPASRDVTVAPTKRDITIEPQDRETEI